MDEGAVARARLTIRCLYPEPGAARVEYKLVRLSPAAEVDRWEYLYVEKVGQVLLKEALVTIRWRIVTISGQVFYKE